MKTQPIILTTALILLGMILLMSCGDDYEKPIHSEYSVMIDLTDSTKVVPDANSIIADLGIDQNIWNSVDFSIGNFTDVSYTPHTTFSLAKAPPRLAASEFTREREVKAFEKKLSASLDAERSDTTGKPNSSLYLPMVAELVRLANSNADRRVLLVFSDLMEHDPDLSFYSPHTMELLRSDPDRVSAMLFAKAKLPNLAGIEIRLIYQPKDAQGDETFQVVSKFFSNLFSQAGAKVTISGSLGN